MLLIGGQGRPYRIICAYVNLLVDSLWYGTIRTRVSYDTSRTSGPDACSTLIWTFWCELERGWLALRRRSCGYLYLHFGVLSKLAHMNIFIVHTCDACQALLFHLCAMAHS